jgi:signal-transduction protein with cAMP-binding, CBS, and nucleotidyltransferase domain
MSVGKICNRDTVIVRKLDSVVEAAKRMRQHHVGSVVIVEDAGEGVIPVGIVTDRDLVLEVLAANIDPNTVRVADLTTHELITARETDGLWDTMQRMRNNGVRRMPVVDQRGLLVGIVAVDDLLELLAVEFNELTRIIAREHRREEKTRPPVP